MTGRRSRLPALLLTLGLAVAAGACSDDDTPDPAADDGSAASTSTTGGGEVTDSTTSTTTASGGTTTAAAGSPTSGPPAAGGAESGAGVIEVTVVGGNVEGGVRREQVKQGSQVTIRVTSDVADELHLHTYDLRLDLVSGQSADLTFLAKVPGVFEVELEGRRKKVLELEVRP